MDPAKVDGLAQVLADVARTRQVIVFSHDHRLADAVRRLPRPPTVWEVQRQERSEVRLVPSADPVARYLDDARAVLRDQHMPEDLRREVVATCCRGALEAAADAKIRAVRLGRGERHAVVEDALQVADTTHKKVTLAVFDDPARRSELFPRLDREGRWAADALRACKEGAHAAATAGPGHPGRARRPPRRLDQSVNPAVRLHLGYAEKLLGGAGAGAATGWSRCAAWLIRLALEHALNGVWARRYPELVEANKRTQLLALAVVADEVIHQQTAQLWSRLSRAGHHHHYELAPTAAELRAWLDEVRALAFRLDNLAFAPATTSHSPQAEP
jgi:hypothetical protein